MEAKTFGTIYDDWQAANSCLAKLLEEIGIPLPWVTLEEIGKKFQAKLTHLDPPLIITRVKEQSHGKLETRTC